MFYPLSFESIFTLFTITPITILFQLINDVKLTIKFMNFIVFHVFWISVIIIIHIINHIVTQKDFVSIIFVFIQIIFDIAEINYALICVHVLARTIIFPNCTITEIYWLIVIVFGNKTFGNENYGAFFQDIHDVATN